MHYRSNLAPHLELLNCCTQYRGPRQADLRPCRQMRRQKGFFRKYTLLPVSISSRIGPSGNQRRRLANKLGPQVCPICGRGGGSSDPSVGRRGPGLGGRGMVVRYGGPRKPVAGWCEPQLKAFTPSWFQAPVRPSGASQRLVVGPPAASIFISFRLAKNATNFPSGDQNG